MDSLGHGEFLVGIDIAVPHVEQKRVDGPPAALVGGRGGFLSTDGFGVGLANTDFPGEFAPGVAPSVGGVALDVTGDAGPVILVRSNGIAPMDKEDAAVVSEEDGGDVWRIMTYGRD